MRGFSRFVDAAWPWPIHPPLRYGKLPAALVARSTPENLTGWPEPSYRKNPRQIHFSGCLLAHSPPRFANTQQLAAAQAD